jgi:hypothetical protein
MIKLKIFETIVHTPRKENWPLGMEFAKVLYLKLSTEKDGAMSNNPPFSLLVGFLFPLQP